MRLLNRNSIHSLSLKTYMTICYQKVCMDGEMFARAVQQWDRDLGETPTFWFTDEDAMKKARELELDDDKN